MRTKFLTLLLIFVGVAPARAEVDFQRDIRPILSNRCFKCHGPAAQKGGLRLDLRERATKKHAIVAGKPGDSELIRRLSLDDDERMPPEEAGARLAPAQIELLKRWIAEGAPYPSHWAFVAPRQAPLPAVRDEAWSRTPLDRFILARLEREGFHPAPEAERATLIRRLSLDLLGVLPSPSEVDAFQRDPSPDAFERLVDRLLASPQYGERQARHWLDLARYADSNGYTIDGKRSIWPWRDWVIGAFNRNLPFDRFTVEQLAGDLLPNPTPDELVATGFHRNTSFNEEGGTNAEQFRVERIVDRTNTTGAVWLGLTVGCAQCHDHKYDPISQKEYYQLYAFFNSTEEPRLSLPTPDQARRLRELTDELAAAKAQVPAPVAGAELTKVLEELEKETNGGWRAIYPKAVTSERGAKLAGRDDRSVVVSGPNDGSDVYTFEAVAPETGVVTAIRIEALTDPSLPQSGPGRAPNGNFVLSQLVFETDGIAHPFRAALADQTPAPHPVELLLKNDPKNGWSTGGGADHQAVLILKTPYPIREGQALNFTLRFSQAHGGYSLGRFRLSLTFASERLVELPLVAQKIVFTEPSRRGAQDLQILQKSLRESNPASRRTVELQKALQAFEGEIDSTLILRPTARPRVTHIQKRGDFLDPGVAVEPGVLAVLPPLPVPATRLDFARWLVAPEQPLTPRVVVNRLWQQYFGKGLVETENDLGMQGALPTHPELLDWLAVELVRSGWDLKALQRLIVTSATYRQASTARPELHTKDANNLLLGRQHRLRLEAEIIRDAALTASGLLTRKLGGPGVYPPQPPEIFAFTQSAHPWPESKGPERYRRGLYTFIWRQSQHPLLTTFDAPDAQTACTRRNRSNTPLQALHLANDPTFMEIATALGQRILSETPADDAARLAHAFRLCFSRAPTEEERSRLQRFLDQHRDVDTAQTWTRLARVLLNLDEFVTRE